MDHPNSSLPEFGQFKCASRMNPTCVVKPAGDGCGMNRLIQIDRNALQPAAPTLNHMAAETWRILLGAGMRDLMPVPGSRTWRRRAPRAPACQPRPRTERLGNN